MSADKNKPADLTIKAKDVQVKNDSELSKEARESVERGIRQSQNGELAAPIQTQEKSRVAVYATENVKSADLVKETEGKEVHLHQINIVLDNKGEKGDKLTRRDVYVASALKGALASQFNPTANNADLVAIAVVKYADAVIARLDQ